MPLDQIIEMTFLEDFFYTNGIGVEEIDRRLENLEKRREYRGGKFKVCLLLPVFTFQVILVDPLAIRVQ